MGGRYVRRQEQSFKPDRRHGSQQHTDRWHDGGCDAAQPLADKYRAFNWHVIEVSGNDITAFITAVEEAQAIYEKPTLILAHDDSWQGCPEIEFDYHWHASRRRPKKGSNLSEKIARWAGKSHMSMLNPNAKLSARVFADDIEQAPTRDGFGKGTVVAGKADENVVVLCADLAESTRAEWFQKEFPDRFIEIGVAEQNMATVVARMALQLARCRLSRAMPPQPGAQLRADPHDHCAQ
jgi:transketolase